jgi:hypothetical protein
MAHIGEKALKGMLTVLAEAPAVARCDTATSVTVVPGIVRIKAALQHDQPNAVDTSFRHAVFCAAPLLLSLTPCALG